MVTFATTLGDGPLVKPLAKLAEVVAESGTFRSQCGLETNDSNAGAKLIEGAYGAKRRVFYPEVSPEQFDVFPSVVLQFGGAWTFTLYASGARHYLSPSGVIRMIVTDKDQTPKDRGRSYRSFANFVGNLCLDIAGLFGQDDRFDGNTIRQEQPPRQCRIEEGEAAGQYYWQMSLLVEW
jgi:hypothetical protein